MEKFKPVLASSTWFSALPPYLQEAMFDKMRLKHLKAGQQLHAKGEDGVGFYGVCEGRLRVVTVGVDGREMLFALLGPGTWVGEISMFDDLPRTHDNFCETNCTVAIIQKNAFKALLEQYPESPLAELIKAKTQR